MVLCTPADGVVLVARSRAGLDAVVVERRLQRPSGLQPAEGDHPIRRHVRPPPPAIAWPITHTPAFPRPLIIDSYNHIPAYQLLNNSK